MSDGYGRLRDDPSNAPSNFTFNNNKQQAGSFNPSFNVPVQVGLPGGYTHNVSVPISYNPDGYNTGPAGQFVQAQFQPGTMGHLPKGRWSDSIFKCFDSMTICIVTCICPCVQFGLVVRRAFPARGFMKPCAAFSVMLLVLYLGFGLAGWFTNVYYGIISILAAMPLWILMTWLRYKLRGKYEITGAAIWDFIVVAFCSLCSLCQEARHVERDYAMPV